VEDDCLIGSGSVVLHRVVVRRGALVGAGALVPNGTEVPSRAMALGVPARIREDSVADDAFAAAVATYVHNGHWYRAELKRLD
jgi:carbonic anhydrase/acetyltransferase-like protein (isoleucine patch superfamily)